MTDTPELHRRATTFVSCERGILAADESIGTMSSRLEAEGVAASEETRRAYRELLLTAPGLSDHVSGIILCDETFRQRVTADETFPGAARERGVLPGIKVDTGTQVHPGATRATVTRGLDGLGARLEEYVSLGAAFAKWRAVVDVSDPSAAALDDNADALAAYARACQAAGVVPIVEPEVLCSGEHGIDECAEVTATTLRRVFVALDEQAVDLAGIVLKPNMVTPGLAHPGGRATPEAVAAATLEVMRAVVPAQVPGIAFLSGGHSNSDACAYLAAINERAGDAPWQLTFSFGRALVSDALRAWAGDPRRVTEAQDRLIANCRRAAEATRRPVAA